MIVAITVLVLGGAWFVYEAFMVGVLWGIACLLFPVVGLVFLLVHWREARGPFAIQLWGLGLLLLARSMVPHGPR